MIANAEINSSPAVLVMRCLMSDAAVPDPGGCIRQYNGEQQATVDIRHDQRCHFHFLNSHDVPHHVAQEHRDFVSIDFSATSPYKARPKQSNCLRATCLRQKVLITLPLSIFLFC